MQIHLAYKQANDSGFSRAIEASHAPETLRFPRYSSGMIGFTLETFE